MEKIKQVIGEVHANFVQAVVEGRKGKLHADAAQLFSGDFWSGQTAVQLGLVDDVGNLMDVMQKEFHTEHYEEYGSTSSLMHFLGGQFSSALDSVSYLYAGL